jgi:DNA (cytosine-5)-methyltransferase 1
LTASQHPFWFIDVFAGIGGFRIGLEAAGGKCVYSIERDSHARQTYLANFGHEPDSADVVPFADLVERGDASLPPYHLLAAGFPCQPFSIAGVSKKNSLGRAHGFADETQGTLFFELVRLIRVSQPPILLLENVKNLLHHDGGRTITVIEGALDELGYTISKSVVDAQHWVPQHRERVFIVGLRRELYGDEPFRFPSKTDRPQRQTHFWGDVVRESDGDMSSFTLSEKLWSYLQEYKAKHRAAGNGFGYGLVGEEPEAISRTLSARYYKDGSEVLVPTGGPRPRMLSPRECARLMGFGDHYKTAISEQQAYRQFGNAVVPVAVEWVAQEMIRQGIIQAAVSGRSADAAERPLDARQLMLGQTSHGE